MTYRIGLEDNIYYYVSELPPDQKPENRLAEGCQKATDLDLLLIATGINDISKADNILQCITEGNLSNLDFVPGMTARMKNKIVALVELSKRFGGYREKPKAKNPAAIFEKIRHYANSMQEHFMVCTLDGAHQLINAHVVSVGLVNRTLVHPREVFSEALKERATAIVMAHNHPSGNLEPSPDDLEVTARIKKAGDLLGVSVLDHIIFDETGYWSMMEAGEFFEADT